ncbi:glycosyltransferase family 4 protein [Pseudoxanthomonas sp. F37]|uniref:glycosyltransferase family 4 protein n=1 Tax=Pseudoxanthomonas TaxID=83618 RepID=UPI001FCFF25A|nr:MULTISPECIES: glycosyltransferase family 4 protein [Pseudoxanthomonas]UOV05408.1 glycosyltransferase family 4 protein [Pseudoxanthomonas mexicana]UOV10411.1 glycosyltransferase family 4 protein [Pseudoxanthomonas sp. F37]
MRIAQISPLFESVPPKLYGGTERVVSYLTEALVARGHHVTLFASGDSVTAADLTSFRDIALRLDPAPLKSPVAAHLSMLHGIRERADEFDVLHFHIDLLPLPIFEQLASKCVFTLHGRQDKQDLPQAYRRWSRYPLVSISDHQRLPLPWANWWQTIPHGMPTSLLMPPPRPRGDYLAFLGRLSPEKRPDRAIEIARRAGLPLRIAAKVDTADRRYFHETIEPLLAGGGVEFVGEIDDAGKPEFLGNAAALLFPIDWPEPFGLVMIESMACGTPVIAWREGSVPEVVDDGRTGFIVDSIQAGVEAVARCRELDRHAVRRRFEQRFDARRMAADYESLYVRMVEGAPHRMKA